VTTLLLRDPWPHLVVDGFLARDEFALVATAFDVSNAFIVEKRTHSTIEYLPCHAPAVYRIFYSIKLIALIDETYATRVRIIPSQGIQFRRTRPDAGRFPVHTDYTVTPCSFVCMLYVNSAADSGGLGGELELYDSNDLLTFRKIIEPRPNRLVVFEAAQNHYHAVAAVAGWTRYMMLMELQPADPRPPRAGFPRFRDDL
jgi:2OG-Fe(II) oxygenase superfamily